MFLASNIQYSPMINQFNSFDTDKSLIFARKAKLTPNFPSNTREIQSECRFCNQNDTFLDFLIGLLSVLKELNSFSIGEY